MNNTATATAKETVRRPAPAAPSSAGRMTRSCLLYTSDAADE